MQRDLRALAEREHDLIVVGGGIYGVAAAWDAAQRGLQVALVEAEDFGGGTSWNSLRTIHGGLRHLQRADLSGHRESVRERRALLRIAPALVRPLPFLVPTYGHGRRGREAFALGLLANDLLAFDRNRGLPDEQRLPPGRMLSVEETTTRLPGVLTDGLTGAALWHDAQVESSERLTIGFLRAAAHAGALVANRAEAVGLRREGQRVIGARVRDRETGSEHDLRARLVLNATGPAADRLVSLAGIARPPAPLLNALNLVLQGPWPLDERFAVGATHGGRFLFLVPWRESLLVGTEYWPEEQREADRGRAFHAVAAAAFPWASLEGRPVLLVHRGLVPGRGGASGLFMRARLHDHEAEDGLAGLITLQGVKYTTARGVAERAIDIALHRLGRRPARCRTSETPLAWARPLTGSLEERTRTAVREEMARTLADAALRRLDLGTEGAPAEAELSVVSHVMAEERGWNTEREQSERDALAAALHVAKASGARGV
jgi:glycerol-3-phosphate dehydrogenase